MPNSNELGGLLALVILGAVGLIAEGTPVLNAFGLSFLIGMALLAVAAVFDRIRRK